MVKGQSHGMHSGGGSPFSKNALRQTRMSNSTPVKNGDDGWLGDNENRLLPISPRVNM